MPSSKKGTAMTTTNRLKTATGASRRTIASYSTYAEAERAVDWLSDHGFAVERSAIVGSGLRSVEQVTGRMTPGRAAKIGAGQGALIGALFALLFGIFFTGPEFVELLLYSLALGALFGALYGALVQYTASGWQTRLRIGREHPGGPLRGPGRRGSRRPSDAGPRRDDGGTLMEDTIVAPRAMSGATAGRL
jgi:hypothetical protein